MTAQPPILFERRGGLGIVTLNRPAALNALTLEMIRAYAPQLGDWAADPALSAVVVRGAGDRAFCAGGDVRALYEARTNPKNALRVDFYRAEYRLNRQVFRFPKPYIALLDGVVMGGGVGISVHGSHRVATERTLFAMPETGIGLFPDVGGGYFLPRCPGRVGHYLALSGARFRAADCLHAGIATHCLPSDRLDKLLDTLAASDPGPGMDAVDSILADQHRDPGPAPVVVDRPAIDRCFASDDVQRIVAALEHEATPWAERTGRAIAGKSPTSLKLAARQLATGAGLDFEEVMRMEFRLSQYCMAGRDFFEGVRAAIIDKDNTPRWRPARLDEVSDSEIDRAFAPLGAGDLTFD